MTTLDNDISILKTSNQLDKLVQCKGILSCYRNYAGELVEISHLDKVNVLGSMGVNVRNIEDIERELKQHQNFLYNSWLPKAQVIAAEREQSLDLYLPTKYLEKQYSWQIITEMGGSLIGHFQGLQLDESTRHEIEGRTISTRQLVLPVLPAGYHKIILDDGDQQCHVELIAAPSRCYESSWTNSEIKLAGLSIQLYSLRSEQNWGIGDFKDLQSLLGRAAAAKLDFVVLNPLHILDELSPEECSPYSPMDRRFLNPLYLDIESEPDFQESELIRNQVAQLGFQRQLDRLRNEELVNYVAVTQLKFSIFLKMFKQFQNNHIATSSRRGSAYFEWFHKKGDALARFVAFQAARKSTAEVHSKDPHFHGYLQWLAESQLESCHQIALKSGMAVGLIRDLAVGSKANSAEVQLNPELFCVHASIGAPSDPLAPQGQNWGLPPINPEVLRRTSYRHFIELLKDNMTHCGALRIDHVMALMRLWWSPQFSRSGAGAYVNYPAEDLFAILRLESQRNRCVVIGEDLGIVPDQVRKLMTDSAIYSNTLFYFEKYDGMRFKKVEHFPKYALSMVANHDVPTLAAWWNKSDLMLRNQIGLFRDSEDMARSVSARESDLIQVLHWLNDQGLLPENWHDFNIHRNLDYSLCNAVLEGNGRSASKLVCIQPEDMSLMEKPINIPGTSNEYPNWRRKLSINIRELFENTNQKKLLETFVGARKQW